MSQRVCVSVGSYSLIGAFSHKRVLQTNAIIMENDYFSIDAILSENQVCVLHSIFQNSKSALEDTMYFQSRHP
jgi:hypothetical protein